MKLVLLVYNAKKRGTRENGTRKFGLTKSGNIQNIKHTKVFGKSDNTNSLFHITILSHTEQLVYFEQFCLNEFD